MQIINDVKLDFDDVLIVPKRSQVASRKDVDLIQNYKFRYAGYWDGVPIIASNMYTTGTFNMLVPFQKENMLVALRKQYSSKEIIDLFHKYQTLESSNENIISPFYNNVIITTGVTREDIDRLKYIQYNMQACMKFVCVDVANGYTEQFVSTLKEIRNICGYSTTIMAGNVVSPEMVQELILNAEVDIVKIGLGNGSVCTTRLVAGVGYPQFSAILECADAAHGLKGHICSDGGIKTPGDIAKAFGAGADFVMIGGMIAGCEECDGEWEYGPHEEKKCFKFYGMSSEDAMNKHNNGVASYKAAEGKTVTVPYKGSAAHTIQQILGGLRSACSYAGAQKLKHLSKCATFVKVNRTHNQVFS